MNRQTRKYSGESRRCKGYFLRIISQKGKRMNVKIKQWGGIGFGLLFICLTSGCASDMNTIVATPPANAQKLGRVEGTAEGHLLFGCIPIGENSRTRRAYSNALAEAPSATALKDVTLQEDFEGWFFGSTRTVTISGEAVK